MKPFLFALLFLLLPKMIFSQVLGNKEFALSPNDRLLYTDSMRLETKSKDFKYIRLIKDYKLNKESYVVLDYYRSGVLEMEGTSRTKDGYSFEGERTYYYENGAKKTVYNYVKGRANGKDYQWYENGAKRLEGEYIENEKKDILQHKINQFWDEKGEHKVVDGNGFFEDKGENASSKGEIKNGFPEGVWEGSFLKLKSTFKETYKDGKLISGESWDENKVSYKYTKVLILPKPKIDMEDFDKYIWKNYRLPNLLPDGAKGKVFVRFIVDADGRVVEPRVLRDIGYGTGQEAIRILTNYDGFRPAEYRGQKVKFIYSLPIAIKGSN